jgi:hypothetical protein
MDTDGSIIAQIRRNRMSTLNSMPRLQLEDAYRMVRELPSAMSLDHMNRQEMAQAVLEHELGIDWSSRPDGHKAFGS